MTGSFNILGIAADADERTIKLAYAKLLKLTRPDDDPDGFQRLNQAYRQALKVAQSRSARTITQRTSASSQTIVATLKLSPNASVGTVPHITRPEDSVHAAPAGRPPILPQPVPAGSPLSNPPHIPARPAPEPAAPHPPRPTFDAQAFFAEYRRISATGGAEALSRWLMDYPAFWHLPTKHAAGQWLLRTLYETPVALPEGCFTATSEFFHYADAISGVDALALRRVGARINAMSLVKPENVRELAILVFRKSQPDNRQSCIRAVKRLSRPFHRSRDLAHALWSPATRTMAGVANALCNGNPDDLPAPINRDHARFWMDACNTTKPRLRLLLAALRCAVALVVLPLAWAALVWSLQRITGNTDAWQSAFTGWQVTFAAVALIITLFWIPIGTRLLFDEADALAARSVPFRLLMAGFTPVLCTLAIVVAHWMDAALGTLLAIGAACVALWRMRKIHQRRPLTQLERVGLVVAFFACLAAVTILLNTSDLPIDPRLVPALAVALICLMIWAIDWRKRGLLRPRVPRTTRNLRRSRSR